MNCDRVTIPCEQVFFIFFGGARKTADRQSGRSREGPFPLPHEGKREKGPLDCKISLLIELLDQFIATSNFGLLNVTKFDSLNVEITLKEQLSMPVTFKHQIEMKLNEKNASFEITGQQRVCYGSVHILI